MSAIALLFLVLGLGLIGWLTARVRATRFRAGSTVRFSSLPSHHGWFVALWTAVLNVTDPFAVSKSSGG